MVKKMKTRLKTEKVMTRKKLEAQIQGKSQMFFRNLQQILEKSCDINRDSNDADRVHTRNTKESSLRRDYMFSHGNILNKDMPINYMCYRCEHFLEIPHNLSQPFSDRESIFKEQCKNELRFIQAIVWLKSSIACASQIPVKQLQQIFNKQWSTHGEDNHHEDEHTDVEQLRFSVDKDLSMYKRMSMKDTIATSTPLNISDVSCITSQRTICSSYARFEDLQGIPLDSVLTNDLNESPSNESLILESSNSRYTIAREKKGCCTIPETDVELVLNEKLDIFDDIPEHQSSFEHEESMGYSAQSALKNGTEQINKKIIENKYIFQKSHADVPSECKYILSVRNQSIGSMFEYNGEGFTSMRNQHDFANKVRELNDSPKSFIITPRNLSQMSNVRNEYFEFLLDNNSPWRANNTATENSNKDSAYSTSHIDIFNCDTAVETGIIGNKRVPNSEHYELQPCKKKTITHKKGKVPCLINRMLTSDDSFKSFTMSEKDISQVLNISNDKNFKFQIVSSDDERMNNISSENSAENDAAVAAKSIIGNKRTKNIEYSYELYPRNENRVTRQKMVSPSIIQSAVIPHTNIEHCYNLRACNNRRISHEKETSSVIIPGPQERKSERTGNLSKEENKNEDEMIFADWLNFTVESLRVERVILTSIKVIVSTFCNKRMAEEYMIRLYLWRNMRTYWKGSLEEEAVNAVLNISDIFTIEEKPNICIKIIVMAIVNTLNEMTMRGQLYKIYCTQTSVWTDRVQILLEFCNSLPICGKVTDYLIRKLKSLQSLLTNIRKIQKYDCVAIKQLHLVFYALNITLQKYRTIIPNDHRSRSVEKVIPHVADLWKVHYINKELEQAGLNLDAAEKQWLNTLENSAKAFMNFGFATFAKKSFSLVHVLIPQSSRRVT